MAMNWRWSTYQNKIGVAVAFRCQPIAEKYQLNWAEIESAWDRARQHVALPETEDLIRAMPLTVAAQMYTANSWILDYNFVRKILLDSGKIPILYCDVVLRLFIDYRIIQ